MKRLFVIFLIGAICLLVGCSDKETSQKQKATTQTSAKAYYDSGNTHIEQGEYDKAIASYKEATRLNPDYAEAHFNLGNTYFRQGELDKAIASYKEVIRIDPNYEKAHYNLGVAYYNTSDSFELPQAQ